MQPWEGGCACVSTSRRMWAWQHGIHQKEEEANPVNTMCIVIQVVMYIVSYPLTYWCCDPTHQYPKKNIQIVRRSRVKAGKHLKFQKLRTHTILAINVGAYSLTSLDYCWLVSLHTNVCRMKSFNFPVFCEEPVPSHSTCLLYIFILYYLMHPWLSTQDTAFSL